MIDVDATRADMLAELGLPAAPERLADPSDPRFADCAEVVVRVRGRPRRELFRLLGFALGTRFAAAPRIERIRDLLAPLRSALGNAHKHGHARDRSRSIDVEIATTPRGALLAVGDEGPGFDVRGTVARMRRGDAYFTQQGSGLRALEASRSRVGWEAGGRRVLICFCPSQPSDARGARNRDDAAKIAAALIAELAREHRRTGAAPLEVSGVLVETEDAPAPLRVRCMLRERSADATAPAVHVLSGRVFGCGDLARADLASARRLREELPGLEVRIPRPIGSLRDEPRVALYDFDPWLDLREYVAQRGSAALPGIARRLGALFAALRRVGGESREPRESDGSRSRFGPDCIHYGVDGRFALDRFAEARRPPAERDLCAFVDALTDGGDGRLQNPVRDSGEGAAGRRLTRAQRP